MNNNTKTLIGESFPRLHVMLLDLGNATHRKYGGAGFSLSGPSIKVEITQNHSTSIKGIEVLDTQGQEDVIGLIKTFKDLFPDYNAIYKIVNLPKQHTGLGTKTSLLLNIIATYSKVFNLSFRNDYIQRLSKRGGTSGIGINVFFTGGFIIDGGHSSDDIQIYTPSSVSTEHDIPPVITHSLIPTSWVFYLLDPKGIILSGSEEIDFFRNVCPIPKEEVLQSVSLAYHSLAPAVILNNIHLLKQAIDKIQSIGFKKREVDNQSETVRSTLRHFSEFSNCAAGLSSTGPLIYIIGKNDDIDLEKSIVKYCHQYDVQLLGKYIGQNTGYNIIID